MSKARELAELIGNAGGTSEQVLSGRRNLIINGDFQVSQRGNYTTATNVSNGSYVLDRWKVEFTAGAFTLQKNTGYPHTDSSTQRIVCTASGTGLFSAKQIIEEKYRGQVLTVSAWVKSNTPNARIMVNNNGWFSVATHSGSGNWEKLTATFMVSTADVRVEVSSALCGGDGFTSVAMTAGDYIETSQVQLELGSVATPFEHRSYGEELALCQRYYYDHTHSEFIRNLSAYSSTGAYTDQVTFPVTMRSTPSITFIFSQYYKYGAGWQVPNSNTAYLTNKDGFFWEPNATNQFSAHSTYLGSIKFKADAEL